MGHLFILENIMIEEYAKNEPPKPVFNEEDYVIEF